MNDTPNGSDLPLIVICTTGGTIAAITGPDGVVRSGAIAPQTDSPADGPCPEPKPLPEALQVALPTQVRYRFRQVLDVDSSQLLAADFDALLDAVTEELADPAVVGVVVLHGTDTMEETAMLLDLHHADPRPVVLTGAQRAADHPDPDGPANLSDAVLIAADGTARDLGVLLSFGRAILQARGVRKWHTTDSVGFAREAPEPSEVSPQGVQADVTERPILETRARLADGWARVDTISCPPGSDGTAAAAVIAAGARGLVLEGTGSGNVPAAVAEVITAHPEVVTVVSSRVPRGSVSPTYGGAGGGATLASAGVLSSGHLRAGQARILLSCLLSRCGEGPDAPEVVRSLWPRFARIPA